MTFGQIVYNIVGIDGILTSTKNDLTGLVDSSNPSYSSLKINITEDLISKIGVTSFDQIGIQAPPGTWFNLNGSDFQVGKNGVYELFDYTLPIYNLRFYNNNTNNVIVDYVINNEPQRRLYIPSTTPPASPSISPWNLDPLMDGTASAGLSDLYARGDHVHPSDTSKANVSTVPASANVNGNNVLSFESNNGISLFSVQLPNSGGGGTPSDIDPLMDDIASPGSSLLYARGDHRHPSDTSKANVSSVPASASVDSSNVMSFASSGGTTLFTVQLPESGGGGTPYDGDPLMDGVASAGISGLYARGDHRHPSDTTIPTGASIDANGLISFKSSTNVTLFTLQLPFYDGSVGGMDAIWADSSSFFAQIGVINAGTGITPITEAIEE